MTLHIRLLIAMARPALAVLLGLLAATGLAQAGRGDDPLMLARVLIVVVAFLVCCVVVNDVSDEAIDRVNLPDDPRRPLVTGATNRCELVAVGATCAAVAVAGAALLSWQAAALVVAGHAIRLIRDRRVDVRDRRLRYGGHHRPGRPLTHCSGRGGVAAVS